MVDVQEFKPGGYRFIKAVFQYSGGVAASPGFRIRRVRLERPLPLARGFDIAEEVMRTAGRPLTSFCACELRSPAPFTEDGFRAFNEIYTGTLKRWSIFDGSTNPVARSNVCPEVDPPAEPSLYAFCYTEPAPNSRPSFVVAGSGEAPEGHTNYRDHIVRLGDTSAPGLREKARFVLGEMERRMSLLGFKWTETTAAQAYTIHDIYPFLETEIVRRGAARGGLTWQFCRPPVLGLEYEMDCRGLEFEQFVPC
jgi:hypothetical protein